MKHFDILGKYGIEIADERKAQKFFNNVYSVLQIYSNIFVPNEDVFSICRDLGVPYNDFPGYHGYQTTGEQLLVDLLYPSAGGRFSESRQPVPLGEFLARLSVIFQKPIFREKDALYKYVKEELSNCKLPFTMSDRIIIPKGAEELDEALVGDVAENYSMKQAIQEGFILDVLKYYTPITSYYKLIKTLSDDPQFDKKKAQKKLRKFVESDSYPIAKKAEMMVEHFHEQVIAKGKIGGKARAMVVTAGIDRAIDYYHAINSCLAARKSPYKTIIAFSGEKEYGGKTVSESNLNGFPTSAIEKTFKSDPYRILIVADKFQTGYDEPLLHTMYVDKTLTDIKAVQTLSRLNRAHPQKIDCYVLDFANDPEGVAEAFSRYYRTTILSGETDPNKLYDLISEMETHEVYVQHHIKM